MRRRATRTVALAITAGLVLAGCSDDDGDGGDEPTEETSEAMDEESEAMEDDTEAMDDDTEAAGETLTVTAVDYDYPDLPTEIAAGSTIVLQNDSTDEVHELLAVRIDDDDERTLEELLALPEEEMMGLFANLRGVALAPPGADSTALPAPALTLSEPGRYVFICALPIGGPPDEVMAAVADFFAAGGEDPAGPDYPETGPPHFTNGMVAEVTVS